MPREDALATALPIPFSAAALRLVQNLHGCEGRTINDSPILPSPGLASA